MNRYLVEAKYSVLRTIPSLTVIEAMQAMEKAGALRSGAAYGKAHKGLAP